MGSGGPVCSIGEINSADHFAQSAARSGSEHPFYDLRYVLLGINTRSMEFRDASVNLGVRFGAGNASGNAFWNRHVSDHQE